MKLATKKASFFIYLSFEIPTNSDFQHKKIDMYQLLKKR